MGDDHLRAGQRRRHPPTKRRPPRRRPTARRPDAGRAYRLTGDKHFGSGSGVADRHDHDRGPRGEDEPTIFVLDVRDRPWDGSAGLQLLAEWDGMGMAATQSHAMRLEGCPAMRLRVGRARSRRSRRPRAPMVATFFTAVILGVLDEAVAPRSASSSRRPTRCGRTSRSSGRGPSWTTGSRSRPTRARCGPSSPATTPRSRYATLRAKEAVADLAEATLGRLARVLGGGTFSRGRRSPHWFEDVRALGFLRPPWGLAYDNLFLSSFM